MFFLIDTQAFLKACLFLDSVDSKSFTRSFHAQCGAFLRLGWLVSWASCNQTRGHNVHKTLAGFLQREKVRLHRASMGSVNIFCKSLGLMSFETSFGLGKIICKRTARRAGEALLAFVTKAKPGEVAIFSQMLRPHQDQVGRVDCSPGKAFCFALIIILLIIPHFFWSL